MIIDLEAIKEDIQNNEFSFRMPIQKITTKEDSIRFCVKDTYFNIELPVGREVLDSIPIESIVKID